MCQQWKGTADGTTKELRGMSVQPREIYIDIAEGTTKELQKRGRRNEGGEVYNQGHNRGTTNEGGPSKGEY